MPHSILIAETDPDSRQSLERYLSKGLGYRVVCVADGRAALEAAMADSFDICIMDVGLGGVNGAETYTRLRALLPNLEMIFLTDQSDEEWTRDFLRFSISSDRVLAKPLSDFSGLTRLIVGILGPPVS